MSHRHRHGLKQRPLGYKCMHVCGGETQVCKETARGFEPRSLASESIVLTVTPRGRLHSAILAPSGAPASAHRVNIGILDWGQFAPRGLQNQLNDTPLPQDGPRLLSRYNLLLAAHGCWLIKTCERPWRFFVPLIWLRGRENLYVAGCPKSDTV